MRTFEERRLVRHALIAIAARRHRPGTGSSVAWLKAKGVDALTTALCFDFTGARWCLVGAMAANTYMSPRHTSDMDIAILARDRAQVHGALRANGFHYVLELNIPGSTWTAPNAQRLDILELDQPWAEDALAQATFERMLDVPVMPLGYLALMKLEASRSIDVGDLSRMLALASESQIATIRRLVAQRMPNDADDLEKLLALGRAELEP